MSPRVSVVIPTYNRPHLVGDAISSVLEQTFQDFEIVVVDDGLNERAKEVVEGFKDARIRYVAHDESRGCSGAKNTGIRESKGEYVAFLDDDDTWMPEKLECQVNALEHASLRAGFSFHAAVEIFDDREARTTVPEGEGDYFGLALRRFSSMIASSLMFKRDVFDAVGFLDESFPTHTDIEFLLRVTQAYNGVGINDPLVKREMRGHHTQMGSNLHNRIRGREMLFARYQDEFEKRPEIYAKHLITLARFHANVGEYKQARARVLEAYRKHPSTSALLLWAGWLFAGLPFRIYQRAKRL